MSAEALGKSVCPFCAVEVREGAVFCFNCGKSVVVTPDGPAEIVSLAAEPEPTQPEVVIADAVEAKAEVKSEAGQSKETKPSPPRVKVTSAPRRRPRPGVRRDLEISWVRPDEGPGAPFVLGAAGVAAVSVLLLLVALYLR